MCVCGVCVCEGGEWRGTCLDACVCVCVTVSVCVFVCVYWLTLLETDFHLPLYTSPPPPPQTDDEGATLHLEEALSGE